MDGDLTNSYLQKQNNTSARFPLTDRNTWLIEVQNGVSKKTTKEK